MVDEASVLVYQLFRRTSTGWDPEPPFSVHVSAGADAALEQLSWVPQDGWECSIAFAPELTSWYGQRRGPDLRTVDIRGELDHRASLPAATTFPGFEFGTEIADPGWRPAGRLRVLVGDATSPVPRWLSWRDRSGGTYSVSFWSPAWSGEPDFFVAGGLRFKKAGLTFTGYHRPAGGTPAPYRGVHTNGEPSDTPLVSPVEYDHVELSEPPPGTPSLPLMTSLPLVRTDFSDDEAWAETSRAVTAERHLSNGDVVTADVDPIDDPRFDGLTAGQLCQLVPPDAAWDVLLVADRTTMTSAEHPVLVVDLDEDDLGRTFRATPHAVQEININLFIGNMDWEDFANDADADGIVRPRLY